MTDPGLPPISKDGSPLVTDEVFNTLSHLAASIVCLLGGTLLIVLAATAHKVWHVVGFSIYGLSLFNLFFCSTLHHGIDAAPRVEDRLRLFDYLAIFFLIAGTFTPICLVLLRDAVGWTFFGTVWAVSLAGVVLKCVRPSVPKRVTMTLYITLGWLAFLLAIPLVKTNGSAGVGWLAAGGLSYTLGGIVFMRERPNPRPGRFGFHEIWHVMVILGALCHYAFMYAVVLPAP
jgi:hemolysin III